MTLTSCILLSQPFSYSLPSVLSLSQSLVYSPLCTHKPRFILFPHCYKTFFTPALKRPLHFFHSEHLYTFKLLSISLGKIKYRQVFRDFERNLMSKPKRLIMREAVQEWRAWGDRKGVQVTRDFNGAHGQTGRRAKCDNDLKRFRMERL